MRCPSLGVWSAHCELKFVAAGAQMIEAAGRMLLARGNRRPSVMPAPAASSVKRSVLRNNRAKPTSGAGVHFFGYHGPILDCQLQYKP